MSRNFFLQKMNIKLDFDDIERQVQIIFCDQ